MKKIEGEPVRLLIMLGLVALWGCTSVGGGNDAESSGDESSRATRAMVAHRNGIEAIRDGDLDEAARILGEALEIDANCGPVHNSLGKVEFLRGNMYGAAQGFRFSASLMPGRAEPVNNIGLVFEVSGQLDKAIEYYRQARELDSGSVEIMGNLARALVKSGWENEEIVELVRRLSLEDPRPTWSQWARKELAIRGH